MPCVWAPRTSNGYGAVSRWSAALSRASTPTWGPLPWVMTSSCSSASGARACTERTTLVVCVTASGRSPRCSSALPPSAATIRTSAAQRRDEDGLDGVHAVLGLVEHDRRLGLEHLVGDLERLHAGLLEQLLAHGGVPVVERGQAVHDPGPGVAGQLHQGG